MSRSRKTLSEMEAKNPHSVTQVNRSAKPGEPMGRLKTGIPDGQTGSYEDLGGPTPENSRPDDESNAIKDAGSGLKRVTDAVTRHAQAGHPMQKMANPVKEETEEDEDDYIDEDGEYEDDDDLLEASKTEDDEEDEDKEEGDEPEEDEEEEEEDKKPRHKKKKNVKEDYDFDDDVDALVAGEELSEEFKEKTRIIYEAAVRSKVSEIKEHLEEQYEVALQEEVQAIAVELQERVDSYLEYVANEWMEQNQLAIEYGIKEQISESFMNKLYGLFEDHYVNLPEEKYDVLENMVHKLDEMEDKLNEQIEKNMTLTQRLSESVADRIFDEVASGLAITQQEKLASLAESVEFDGELSYREKLETLRESYFPTRPNVSMAKAEVLLEDTSIPQHTDYSVAMERYLQAASLVANV